MDLVENLRNAVLRQREDEVTNFFTRVEDLRDFISATEPTPGVNITIKMCCFSSERLTGDNGTRVTLVNKTAHGLFDEIQKDLTELNSINRKPFIAQITVWDAKRRSGSPRTARVTFRPGAVYEFKQVHSVGYYSEVAKGSVQLDDSANDRVVETTAPVLKRKTVFEQSGRYPKARAILQGGEGDEQSIEGESATAVTPTATKATSAAGTSSVAPRKRGAAVSRG